MAAKKSNGGGSDTLVCSIELSKTNGITIKVDNIKDEILQTVHMDGTKITTLVKGKKGQSTITQDQESVVIQIKDTSKALSTITQKKENITIECKLLEVKAETVKYTTEKDTTFTAKGKYSVTSTKDTALTSKAKTTLKSTKDMSLTSSAKLNMKATSNAALDGANVAVKGKSKVTIKGNTGVDVSAIKVGITGKAKASLEAPVTNVGKDLTSVKGKLVKCEGMLVKLG